MGSRHGSHQFFVSEAVLRVPKQPSHCLIKMIHDLLHVFCHAALTFRHHPDRYTVKGLSNAPGNTCQSITVPAKRNSSTNDIFEIVPFKKCCDGFRYGFLTAFHMMVSRTDFVTGTAEIISEFADDIIADLFFGSMISCHEDRTGYCFCAFDSLRMVVCHFGGPCRSLAGGVQVII